jgi:alpha-glucoside transport system permease protein
MTSMRITNRVKGLPLHLVVIGLCVIWLVPALGLLVTSIRPRQDVNETGWWTVLSAPKGAEEYGQFCSECHGDDGRELAAADLSNPELIGSFTRSIQLRALLNREYDGQIHLAEDARPDDQQLADILGYLQRVSGLEQRPRTTLSNYQDALVGYRGTETYAQDCAAGVQPPYYNCNASDYLNERGMGRAFVNSLLVTIPSTILPLLFAATAAYAFSWLDFRGRFFLFALLVGLQIIPLQMVLIPISKIYARLNLNGQFLGVWLFHTGFGLPYAIYLMRNFIGALPRDLFESVYLDGANHWTAFYRLALPLSAPALASLAIFQLLWVWNDLLVALVYLGGARPVMTYQISNLVTSLGGGWHLLTAAAFLSMALPMLIFLGLQRYFVRGLLAGSVKG